MHHFDWRPNPAQSSLDIHQTTDIATSYDICTRIDDILNFDVDHGRGNLRIFNREGAAKTAAAIRISHFDKISLFDMPYQLPGLFPNSQGSQQMARVVIGNLAPINGPQIDNP